MAFAGRTRGVPGSVLAERGDGPGGADDEGLTDGAGRVEPDEPEKSVSADAGEQIGDLRRLTCGRQRGRLGNEDRGTGQGADGRDGGPEQ